MEKKSGKMFNKVSLYFKRKIQEKNSKGEKISEMTFSVTSTLIISASFLAGLFMLLKGC
jgi:hypothetical protein